MRRFKSLFWSIIPSVYLTYALLVVIPLLGLNLMISKPSEKDIDPWGLMFRYDNNIRPILYPPERIKVYKSMEFDKEKREIQVRMSLYDHGPIGYALRCNINSEMTATCELIVFSISFGAGSYDTFQYEWREIGR